MNKQEIALQQLYGIVVDYNKSAEPANASLSLVSEFIALGYMPSIELTNALSMAPLYALTSLRDEVLPVLAKAVGAHRNQRPLYPNFPDDIVDDEGAIAINKIISLHGTADWDPNLELPARKIAWENVKFRKLNLVTESQFDTIFTDLLKSADSISDSAKKTIEWFIKSDRRLVFPDNIPFKENVCIVAGLFLKQGKWDDNLVKTSTDVLRIITYLSDGDISLAENTKFKNLPRSQRKILVKALARVTKNAEDLLVHKNKWIKAGHMLHIGDYSKTLYDTFKILRHNMSIQTYNGVLEGAIQEKDWHSILTLVKTRPGVFARKIAKLLTIADKDARVKILTVFETVVDEVPTRNLTQLWGSIKTRDKVVKERLVFPKGSVAKAYMLRNELKAIPKKYINTLIDIITKSLVKRFTEQESLGKVYIDPRLIDCPLPTGQRSASAGAKQIARGSRMPIGNKNTLRFFIYWVGDDIDLSGSFHDENFNHVGQVTYYHQAEGKCVYSGDITSAPNGASEFIDVDIDYAINEMNARYVAMHVYVYSGPNFSEHDECFAGWMTRDNPGSNEVYEPKSVQQKIDVVSETRRAIPVMFDLVERKAIWMDVTESGGGFNRPNNVENSRASTRELITGFANLDNKVSLYELFKLHTKARGEEVDDINDADTIFTLDDTLDTKDKNIITPYDIIKINSDFVV